ncbi:3'-5' exonuclease [Candidatus Woesearchaeota archaeon]|nr:3'-5' exonuclease [Candidatus Woesearchaeota archaeon]
MIVVDVETSGLDPQKNSILSIGAVEFHNPKNQFSVECRPFDGAEVSDGALRINGFTTESIFEPSKPTLELAIKKFLEWASCCLYKTLAGENPSFDKEFLQASAERYTVEWKLGRRTVDLHSISYAKHLELGKIPLLQNGISELRADATYSFVGIPEEPTPHNALNGAKWEAEAFSRLLYGCGLFKEFQTFPVPDYLLK